MPPEAPIVQRVRTTCPYCGVGCGVIAEVAADGGIAVKGDPEHPANRGRLCSKGSALAETLGPERRLRHPEIGGRRVDWETALDRVAAEFRAAIAEHGPDAVAFYVSGQLLTEDYYVANKLMKGFIGSANIDTNSRLCMASSVAGHKRAFGEDVVPCTYEDLEEADLVVLVGSNLAWCHPVLYQRLAAARAARPEMALVVVDPRRTATVEDADMHLAIAPDSDVALFAGLLDHLAVSGAADERFVAAHTEGAEAALAAARAVGLDGAAAATGLALAELGEFYNLFARTERVVTLFSQGVNQSARGTDKVNAIVNCHLLTGRIGRPGMGPFSITGQPNAMGGREVGGLANQLAAHLELDDKAARAKVQAFWGAPRIAGQQGLKAVELFRAVAEGKIKALWIMATSPVDSLPDAGAVAAALAECPFVVVSDIVRDSATAAHADVLLPAAGWGEKDGTVTNSERMISRQRPFMAPPGEARPDWWIVAEVARRMGFAEAFDYAGPAAIFREHAALTAIARRLGRRFDIAALDRIGDDAYDRLPPLRWPLAGDGGRLFADGDFPTPSGRARFVATVPASKAAAAFVLNTGRVRDQWHTMTRTGRSPRLGGHIAEPFCELHPDDAARSGIAPATLVEVANERGRIVVRALITTRQQPGRIFVPMHWTDQRSGGGRVNLLVAPDTDPVSGQAALKSSAVEVRPFAARWYGFAVSRDGHPPAVADYWARAVVDGGWRLELAGRESPEAWPAVAAELFGVDGERVTLLGYRDAGADRHRFAAFAGEQLVGALFIAPEPVEVSRAWLSAQLGRHLGSASARLRLLAGRDGADTPDPGPLVCSCFGVGSNDIAAFAARSGCRSVDEVGEALQAGTNCGSCRAEIRRIIDAACLEAAD